MLKLKPKSSNKTIHQAHLVDWGFKDILKQIKKAIAIIDRRR